MVFVEFVGVQSSSSKGALGLTAAVALSLCVEVQDQVAHKVLLQLGVLKNRLGVV